MTKRILVVEDQPDNRQIIRDMLAPTDYEITEAEDGQQALEAIAKQRPDLILMDIQLPPRAKSRPIPQCDRSRSGGHLLMRSAAKKRRRARRAAMITFRSPSAHVSYWRKSGNSCPKAGIPCCSARVRFWHKADIPITLSNVCFWG